MGVDRAFANELELEAHLEHLLNSKVLRLSIVKVNMVNDSTIVDVRFRLCRDAGPVDSFDTWANDLGTDAMVEA